MQELSDVGIETGMARDVPDGAGELRAGPRVHDVGGGELGAVDVDDAGVRRAELVHVREGVGVNLFREREAVATSLGQADEFFEPRRASGLEVDARAGALERAADDGVEAELVAAAVDAEFQVPGQAVGLHRVGDDGEVVVELALELREVADVVHAFVETSGELRRDGLRINPCVGEEGENDEQLRRRLRGVGLVHGDFGDEFLRALHSLDVVGNLPSFPSGTEVFPSDGTDTGCIRLKGLFNPRDGHGADEFRVLGQEPLDVALLGLLPDAVGDINGEEVGAGEKLVHGFHADVIGVHVPAAGPVEGRHCGLRGVEDALGVRADEGVFAVGFVPDGHDGDALRGGELESVELGLGLVGEAVADADGKFFECQHEDRSVG